MKTFHYMVLAGVLFCATQAWTQPAQRGPHIGYLYPAGGSQGATIRILAGGQYLRGTDSVYISGEGVEGSVTHRYQPIRNINGEQRAELVRRLWEAWEKRRAELPEEERNWVPTAQAIAPGNRRKPAPETSDRAKLPDHPLLNNIEDMNLYQIASVMQEVENFRKRQPNMQLSELVEIEIRIAANAPTGNRELRLGARSILTNPLCFQVGMLPETFEQEPNDPHAKITLPETPPLNMPVLLNGQIKPGDADRFSFRGQKDQMIVVNVAARHLIPYLADAVPGWFQAVVTLYDSSGMELAYADDYRFDPDPVLVCSLPQDDTYTLEIRDALYRGRDDFVYRMAVGELPFISHLFPAGGAMGTEAVVAIYGYNLPVNELLLDTTPGSDDIRQTHLLAANGRSNDVFYAVNDLPECIEIEPNNTVPQAQQITPPVIVNGLLQEPGDVDVFSFEGQRGEEFVAEIVARRLHSPLDGLVRILDAQGNVLEWNDDCKDRMSEIFTHHADSRVLIQLPENGQYHVQVSDTQHQGGHAHTYRLHVRKPQPDFALLATPSSLNIPAGHAAPVSVHVVRKDGFTGDIILSLPEAPKGFRIDGGRIPAGRDHIRATVSAPLRRIDSPLPLQIIGTASVQGETISHPAVPAEDMMQAFLPRHLVRQQQLLTSITHAGRNSSIWRQNAKDPVSIARGGRALVSFKIPERPKVGEIFLELNEPPEGFSIGDIDFTEDAVRFFVNADEQAGDAGYEDNLIVNISMERPVKQKDGTTKQTRIAMGTLPAIPIRITQ